MTLTQSRRPNRDDDVSEELASMAGTADTEDVRVLRRPEEGARPTRSPSPRPRAAGREGEEF